ncbi:MAG: hypothetical protein LBI91_01995 [Spirochaetaceae bacterium]|jgi:hypothetical protein|nr:hypothetical protein [Spirochaetaceae bacterium]
MAVSIFRQKYKLRFLVSLIVMIGSLFLSNYLFRGPRLGFFYDFLMKYRRGSPVSPELALIETGFDSGNQDAGAGQLIDPVTAGQVILVLAELEASGLIIQTPILGASLGSAGTEEELRAGFYEEFALLEQNIRNLFQGIRVGSITPGESEQYVADLILLTEMGKERLVSSFLNQDESGTAFLERAVEAFGNVWQSEDIRVSLIRRQNISAPGETGRRYSRLRPDPDGVFRRIAPVLFPPAGRGREEAGGAGTARAAAPDGIEHIAYAALKSRFNRAGPEVSGGRLRLRLSNSAGEDLIALDRGGNILVEGFRGAAGFKRVPLPVFLEYERAEQELFALFQEAETRGYFAYLDPEDYPVILYRYSRNLRDEMLEKPDAERKIRWLNSRGEYLKSIENYLDGSSESSLVTGYEKLIAREHLAEGGIDQLVAMRDSAISFFMNLREKYEEFSSFREEISAVAEGSLCIMGPVSAPGPVSENSGAAQGIPPGLKKIIAPFIRGPNPTDAEASAILANSILTGRAVIPLADHYLFLWSGCIAFAILFLLRKTRPVFTIVIGLVLVLFEALVFSLGFVFTDYWIDPLPPVLTAGAGVFASFFMAVRIKKRESKQFRLAYGPNLARPYLRQVIRAGHPRPGELLRAKAAVITVRQPSLLSGENRENPREGAALLRNFRRAVFRHFARFGGVFTGAEGDLVMIAFGSPLERAYLNSVKSEVPYEDEINAHSNNSPASKAVGATMDLISHTPEGDWCFGIDTGECAFVWAEPGGYSAFGSPLVRSKILAGIAPRYNARILATTAVIEKIDGVISQKLDILKEKSGKQEAFYKLITGKKTI